jgi:hypothetical protein
MASALKQMSVAVYCDRLSLTGDSWAGGDDCPILGEDCQSGWLPVHRDRQPFMRDGADDVYVPAPDKSARDERVREMFNGRNIKELMQLFGLARSTVYRIVGQHRRP